MSPVFLFFPRSIHRTYKHLLSPSELKRTYDYLLVASILAPQLIRNTRHQFPVSDIHTCRLVAFPLNVVHPTIPCARLLYPRYVWRFAGSSVLANGQTERVMKKQAFPIRKGVHVQDEVGVEVRAGDGHTYGGVETSEDSRSTGGCR